MSKTFLTLATSALLVGCSGIPPYPAHMVYDVDLAHKACGEYEIVDKENMKFKHVRDLPLKECDGLIGMKARDFAKVKHWGQDVRAYAAEKCK